MECKKHLIVTAHVGLIFFNVKMLRNKLNRSEISEYEFTNISLLQ